MTAARGPLVLASASPRRREILSALGLEFEVHPSGADEGGLRIEDHLEFVRAAALLKLQTALDVEVREGVFVLAADTIVTVDDQRLGKPVDDLDAVRMLSLLAGRDHLVRTAIALGRAADGVLASRVVETRVWFKPASREALARYVAAGESLDKAGAYGIQGLASGFVTRLEGSYTNVVGLPASEVISMLLDRGALEQWP
ncbi:MAG TPA: Maf family protein [Polyangiales bacterium]|nr:Maf family protein [Polyangiales bacterium]